MEHYMDLFVFFLFLKWRNVWDFPIYILNCLLKTIYQQQQKKNKEYPGVLDLSRNALYSIFSFPSIWSSLWFYHLRFLHSHCKLESYRNTWKSKLSSSSFVNISTWSPKFSSNTMVMISRIIEDSFSNWK